MNYSLILNLVMAVLLSAWLPSASAYAQAQTKVYLLKIEGAIGPATQDYVSRGLTEAAAQRAEAVVLQMDTPGGLDKSMREIIKSILASPVPVISYVAPSGARAASAGTYILYASHIAAMAPGTNLGAATPVQIGGAAPKTPASEPETKKEKTEQQPADAGKAKMTNDAVAYIKSLAELRGRNVEWAESAVRQAASLTAAEALQKNVITLIADNVSDLLNKVNGMKVEANGKTVVLDTQHSDVQFITPDWRARFLAIITDPSIAYILLLIGVYGLFFEFANPGFIVPGVAGAISLLLALYAFQLLPVSYAGVGLILLGLAFMAAEAFMPSFGALGIGGLIAFIVGSVLLIDTGLPAFSINWYLILIMALINAAFFIGVIGMVLRARRRKPVSGREELLQLEGVALEDFDEEGWILIHGERWRAVTKTPVRKNDKVRVEKLEGLILKIKP